MPMNTRIHNTVAAVVKADGRYLLVEEWVDGQRRINQPAGHLEPGEGLAQAVVRETLEETACHLRPQGLVGIYRWRHPSSGETFLRATFYGEVLRQEPDRELDEGIIQSLWLSREEILQRRDRLRSPLVLRCVEDYEQGARYPLSILRDVVHGEQGMA